MSLNVVDTLTAAAEDGATGATGAVMRGPQAWGDCADGFEFKSGATGESWKDVVYFGDYCYECATSHTKTATNNPLIDVQSGGGLWKVGQSINIVATYLLMTTYALIENLGVAAIEMKDSDGNILLQAKDGAVTCNMGTFNAITVNNGTFTNMAISGSSRLGVFDLTTTSAYLGYLIRPDNNSRIFVSAMSAAYEIYLLEYPDGTELEITFTPAIFTRVGIPITTIYSQSGFINMNQLGYSGVTETYTLSVTYGEDSVVNGGYARLVFKGGVWYIISMTGGCYTY